MLKKNLTRISVFLISVNISGIVIAQDGIVPPELPLVQDDYINVGTAADWNIQAPTIEIREKILEIGSGDRFMDFERVLSKTGSWRHNYSYVWSLQIPTFWSVAGESVHIVGSPNPQIPLSAGSVATDVHGDMGWGLPDANGDGLPEAVGVMLRDGTKIAYNTFGAPLYELKTTGLKKAFFMEEAPSGTPYGPRRRVKYVVQNDGFAAIFSYRSDDARLESASDWRYLQSVSLVNLAHVGCNLAAPSRCSVDTELWPTATFSGPSNSRAPIGQAVFETALTNDGFARSYKRDDQGRVVEIVHGSSTSSEFKATYWGSGYGLKDVTLSSGEKKTYATEFTGGSSKLSISSNRRSRNEEFHFDSLVSQPIKRVDFNGGISHWTWQFEWSLMTSFKDPENNVSNYEYDNRANARKFSRLGSAGSGSNLIKTVDYPDNCPDIMLCTKPISETDFSGNRTDYEYDPVHGGLIKVTFPADPSGIRPQTRYSYVQKYAWLKDPSGSFVPATSPIWLLSTEEYCKTSSATAAGGCIAGVSDEVVTTYEYEQGSASKGSNLFLLGVAVTDGGQTLRSCFGYDIRGRKISEFNQGLE